MNAAEEPEVFKALQKYLHAPSIASGRKSRSLESASYLTHNKRGIAESQHRSSLTKSFRFITIVYLQFL